MDFAVGWCPRCQERPVEYYELPQPFPADARVPVDCHHCGASLWAVRTPHGTASLDRVVFIPREPS